MFRWLEQRREARALRRHAIPDVLWHTTLLRYPFLRRPPAEEAVLRRLTTLFLAEKEFQTAGDLSLTDDMAVTVAAQACLPVLHLGLDLYRGFVGIVLHPGEVYARRSVQDEDGLVHEYDEPLIGEAMEGGPVMLSWNDVRQADQAAQDGTNLVLHEFAHVIDLADGLCDGVPPMPDKARRAQWLTVWNDAYRAFCDRVESAEGGLTPHPLLDPYGAESLQEFFPVATEAFFCLPREFAAEYPLLYEQLAEYFRQRP